MLYENFLSKIRFTFLYNFNSESVKTCNTQTDEIKFCLISLIFKVLLSSIYKEAAIVWDEEEFGLFIG